MVQQTVVSRPTLDRRHCLFICLICASLFFLHAGQAWQGPALNYRRWVFKGLAAQQRKRVGLYATSDAPSDPDTGAGRRGYLLAAYSAVLAGLLSAFIPAVRQSDAYKQAIAWVEGTGGTPAGRKETELLRRAIAASPACQSEALQALDLGAGTGGDFAFLLEGTAQRRVKVLAVEPNTFTWATAEAQAREVGLDVEPPRSLSSSGSSQSTMSLFEDTSLIPDGSVSLVLAKRVLCSVDAPDAVVREIFRVLRPGGVFFFIEHVSAEEGSPLRLLQEVYRPIQQAYANNCDPARDTASTIRKAAPWDQVQVENFDLRGGGPITTHIRGFARKLV